MSATHPFISVIIPVKNGEGRLERCLESLRAQDYPPERFEVIIADGRSTDRTVEIARAFGARVVDNPGESVACGRNEAFRVARGELIASTDDDCILPPSWLTIGSRILMHTDFAAVGGPTPLPDSATPFARAAYLLFELAANIGYSVQADLPSSRESRDLPGCNVLYRQEALARMMPFIDCRAEDVELHARMRKAGYRLVFHREVIVFHDKRQTVRRFLKQMVFYGRGRLQVGRRHPETLRPLHRLTALVAPAALLLAAFCLWNDLGRELAIAGAFGVLAALGHARIRSGSWRIAFWFPLILVFFFGGWSWGYLDERITPSLPDS